MKGKYFKDSIYKKHRTYRGILEEANKRENTLRHNKYKTRKQNAMQRHNRRKNRIKH